VTRYVEQGPGAPHNSALAQLGSGAMLQVRSVLPRWDRSEADVAPWSTASIEQQYCGSLMVYTPCGQEAQGAAAPHFWPGLRRKVNRALRFEHLQEHRSYYVKFLCLWEARHACRRCCWWTTWCTRTCTRATSWCAWTRRGARGPCATSSPASWAYRCRLGEPIANEHSLTGTAAPNSDAKSYATPMMSALGYGLCPRGWPPSCAGSASARCCL